MHLPTNLLPLCLTITGVLASPVPGSPSPVSVPGIPGLFVQFFEPGEMKVNTSTSIGDDRLSSPHIAIEKRIHRGCFKHNLNGRNLDAYIDDCNTLIRRLGRSQKDVYLPPQKAAMFITEQHRCKIVVRNQDRCHKIQFYEMNVAISGQQSFGCVFAWQRAYGLGVYHYAE